MVTALLLAEEFEKVLFCHPISSCHSTIIFSIEVIGISLLYWWHCYVFFNVIFQTTFPKELEWLTKRCHRAPDSWLFYNFLADQGQSHDLFLEIQFLHLVNYTHPSRQLSALFFFNNIQLTFLRWILRVDFTKNLNTRFHFLSHRPFS